MNWNKAMAIMGFAGFVIALLLGILDAHRSYMWPAMVQWFFAGSYLIVGIASAQDFIQEKR
jgi:hypothetical protein